MRSENGEEGQYFRASEGATLRRGGLRDSGSPSETPFPSSENTHRYTQSNRLDREETYCVLGERMRRILPDLVSTTVASLLGLRLLTPLGRFSIIVARTQPTATAEMALDCQIASSDCSPARG